MDTAIVSDLHLGTTLESDLARRSEPRRALIAELARADQVVLLGDVLELRQGPVGAALAAALPFFEELGATMGDRRVVVVPGNHDHQLVSGLLEGMRADGESLEVARAADPSEAGPLAERLARALAPARLELAYPGLWLRPDVYATHGHYLDVHLRIPRVECLAIGAVAKLVGDPPGGALRPGDYETLVGPVYALAYSLAQGASPVRGLAATQLSMRIWSRLDGPSSRDLGARMLGGVILPAAVAALNRAGLGPFTAELTGSELRRAGLEAMAEVVGRLGLEAEHVIFGHTHRAGPLPEDREFGPPDAPRLTNTGSWVEDLALGGLDLRRSPYRPGVVGWVRGSGPPELVNVLDRATARGAA